VALQLYTAGRIGRGTNATVTAEGYRLVERVIESFRKLKKVS
jgi:hypothetical protein